MSLLLALMLCVPADTFTVDDDGLHADFPSLVAAVAAVADGDVLQVEAGDYEPFTLTKNVMILGPADGPRPKVQGRSVVHDATGAMIGGLDFGSFAAESVSGSLLLDDCTFGTVVASVAPSTLDVVSCDAVEVQRCVVRGLDDSGATALHMADSRVSVVACQIVGGSGVPASALGCVGDGGKGGPGIRATSNTKLNVTNCIVRGGQGGASCGLPALDGAAGDGLVAADSLTVVRGAPTDSVSDGPWDPVTSSPGKDIVLVGGKLVISGVSYQPSKVLVTSGGALIDPGHAEPWLTLNDATGAGDVLELSLEGPPAAPALFFGGILPALFGLGQLESPLWLAADHSLFIITLVTQGAGAPVILPFTIPPGLEGLEVHLQAVFTGLPSAFASGKVIVTNPVSPVIRF